MVKKIFAAILTVALLAVFTLPAFAVDIRYVDTDRIAVLASPNLEAEVIATRRGGDKLLIEQERGNWVAILVEDTVHGGQTLGYLDSRHLSYTMPQRYCHHEWDAWEVIQNPTCTRKGVRTHGCVICGMGMTEDIKPLGHDWGRWKVTKEATCIKKGSRTRTCSRCGDTETEEFYADHEYGKWVTTKEPTCTEKGQREHTCKVCGKVETKSIDKLPHNYEWKVLVETTDHSAGVRAKVCVDCGYQTKEESFDPDGTLRRKDRGEAVRKMQQLLVEQGYLNKGGADGVFGGGTEKALKQYQLDRGLNPDGVAWPQTLKDLEHDFGPWTTVQAMTRANDGLRERVCRGCGFKQTEVIPTGNVFEKGDRGEDVRAMQQLLKQLGYDPGSLDGIYGKKLDKAMASFAKANGLLVEQGRIRPADVDAVFNAWLDQQSEDQWKGEGTADSAVNLALTVTPVDEADDSGVTSYYWSVTNLGDGNATFTALLLTFGDQPDFRKNNLVMQLGGANLKKNSGNSASGSFSVDGNWGEGKLNFAALAVDDNTGDLWLSNTVDFENSTAVTAKTVAPIASEIDVNELPDGTYPVSFNPGDVFGGASGVFLNAVHVYSMDVYDTDDVNALAVGDTLVAFGKEIAVTNVDREDGWVKVNGDEVTLCPLGEGADGYRVIEDDDAATFTELGVTTLTLDSSAVFNDSSDIEGEPVSVKYDGIANAIAKSDNPYFNEYNTTVRIENGRVVEICRVYMP